MKLRIYLMMPFAALFLHCGGDDQPSTLDACGNPTTKTVNDKRCLYTVSTLTESFDGSGGLTVDEDGFIYVADFGNRINNADGSVVSKVDPTTGEVSTFATGLRGPSGNTFAQNGNLIQANIQGNTVSEITPEGVSTIYTNSGLLSPVGVAFDSSGNLFVCNCAGSSIQQITPDRVSSTFTSSASLLRCPNGLTIDNQGNLYAANFSNGNVVKIDPTGEMEVFATIPGNNNAHIVFGNDVLYVLGRSGNSLYEVTLEGEVSIIAGTGEQGNEDGTGTEATFYIPNGIGLSPDQQKIYVVSRLVGEGSPLNPVVVRVIQKL